MVSLQSERLRDRLTGRLIGLARAADGSEHLISDATTQLIVEALCAMLPDANCDDTAVQTLIWRAEAAKQQMVPNCFTCAMPCGRTSDYDMTKLWNAEVQIRDLKSEILSGICGVAACAYRAAALGLHDADVDRFFYKALFAIGMDDWGANALRPVITEMGKVHRKAMELLDKANSEGNNT